MSLKARRQLVLTLLDSALEDLPEKDAEVISELLWKRAVQITQNKFDIDIDNMLMLTMTSPTQRLLTAINDHMIATDEAGDTIVERLIACLGSQDAYASQPN
jgi:hypothetical protein